MASQTPTQPAASPQRALKTLLMTDLVDSTALVDALGDYRAAQVFERFDRLARDLLVQHDGIEIDKTDGFLLLFDRPVNAVWYALAFHEALAELSSELDVKLAARAGIHLGEVVLRQNPPEYVVRGAKPLEIEGLAKPMAARLMSLAQGTQTLMTRSAFDVARRAAVGHTETPEDIRWIDHGQFQLKGIVEPQAVCEVGRKNRAPLSAPPDSEKVWRVSAIKNGDPTDWRPASGLVVPGREGWRLERKLGEGDCTELWLAREIERSHAEATLAYDEVVKPHAETALLFSLTRDARASGSFRASWKVGDPVATLTVTSSAQKGAFVVIADKPSSGGRDPSMDLQIHDPKVSRQHYEVRRRADGHTIRALRAKNGVFINGIKIAIEQLLQNGDHVRIGETDLVFYQDDYSG